jgi:hypothetical protein
MSRLLVNLFFFGSGLFLLYINEIVTSISVRSKKEFYTLTHRQLFIVLDLVPCVLLCFFFERYYAFYCVE